MVRTIKLEVLTLPAAAARKGISRQAMWRAVKDGRVNAVQDDSGDWHVYADDRLEVNVAEKNSRSQK